MELISPLISGKKYNVEFYVSLVDSCWYAINSLGACLTTNGIGNNLDDIFTLIPQIQNPDTFFLAAKDKWMKVSGSFFADGTERFIAIGNFRNNQNTDTILVHQSSNWVQAHYYLDDVSVTLDTTTGINELEQLKFEIYPNPAKERVTIETAQTNNATTLRLFDVTGREVLTTTLTASKTTIDLSVFSAGVYTAMLLRDDVAVGRRKIIIE